MAAPAAAQVIPRSSLTAPATAASVASTPPYAVIADLVVDSPLIVDATIRRATRLRPAEAPATTAGNTSFYVEADVRALILGQASLPARVTFVDELANDVDGRPPRFPRDRELLFARTVGNQPNAVQLIRRDARVPWSPDTEALVRRIAAEAVRPDAPPAITGIGNAVHSAGALPGEGQSQIFLAVTGDRPVSLVIDRAQDAPPRWSVVLGELVGQAVPPPARATLLWYRLACGLPTELPAAAVADLDAAAADVVRADYNVVRESLGPCDRLPVPASVGGAPG